jgi:hypothetical protein
LLGFFVVLLCATPVPVLNDETIIPAIDAAPAQVVSVSTPRVYGIDLSEIIYSSVETSSYRNFVRDMSEIGSRFIMNFAEVNLEGNRNAREYVKQNLADLSKNRIEVEEIGNYKNVVGKLPGYLPGDNPALAISAFYDSVENSPGANCDGSGVAAVLELARVMSEYEWPLDIYFIAFNGHFGYRFLQGSLEVANEFNTRGIELLMLYNVDTILVQDRSLPSDERIQMGYAEGGQSLYHTGQFWAELTRTISNNIGDDMIIPVSSTEFIFWGASDHYRFYNDGFNAMCAFESGPLVDESYHLSNDLWDHYQFDYNLGRETTAVIGASMAHIMSRTYGEKTTSNYEITLSSQTSRRYYIPISTPTTLNFTARWFGGSSSFFLLNPVGAIVSSGVFNHSSAWEPTNVFNPTLSTKGLYTLVISKNHIYPVGYEIQLSYYSDIDGNGVSDDREFWIDGVLFESDQDEDGLSDAQEIFLGTDLMSGDSDEDTIPDKFEVDNGLDPLNPSDASEDADDDQLSNAQEYSRGLNLFSADSDSDSMDDFWEVENGLDPLVDDSMLDLDDDGITNLQEYLDGTNPQVPEALEIPLVWISAPFLLIALIGALLYVQRYRNLDG